MPLHKVIRPADNHGIQSWVAASDAEQNALVVTATDVGRVLWRSDNNTFWILVGAIPVKVWKAMEGNSAAVVIPPSNKSYAIVGIAAEQIGKPSPRWYPDRNITIKTVYFSASTPGSGNTDIDVKKNGVSIFTVRPIAAAGQYKSSTINVNVSVTPTDYLTVEVMSAQGSENLNICVVYE